MPDVARKSRESFGRSAGGEVMFWKRKIENKEAEVKQDMNLEQAKKIVELHNQLRHIEELKLEKCRYFEIKATDEESCGTSYYKYKSTDPILFEKLSLILRETVAEMKTLMSNELNELTKDKGERP